MARRHRHAGGSGLRIGELVGLQVRDVDFLKRTIRVERQRARDGRLTPPKSPSSVRTVPVGQVVINEFAAHLARYPSSTDLFRDEFGKPLQYRRWKHIWAGAAREVQISFTSHALRHFFASALISGGASVKQVQSVLGHASAVITLRVYSHLWPGDEDPARVVMDAALMSLEDHLGDTAVPLKWIAGGHDSGADPLVGIHARCLLRSAAGQGGQPMPLSRSR